MSELLAVVDEDQVVVALLYMADHGCFKRDGHDWVPLDPDDPSGEDDFEDFTVYTATDKFTKYFDGARDSDGVLTLKDVL